MGSMLVIVDGGKGLFGILVAKGDRVSRGKSKMFSGMPSRPI